MAVKELIEFLSTIDPSLPVTASDNTPDIRWVSPASRIGLSAFWRIYGNGNDNLAVEMPKPLAQLADIPLPSLVINHRVDVVDEVSGSVVYCEQAATSAGTPP